MIWSECVYFPCIHAVQIPEGTEDEAVRIFLEFDRLESAIKGTFLIFMVNFPLAVLCCIWLLEVLCSVFESRGNPGVTHNSRITPELRGNSILEPSNRRHRRGNPGQVKWLLTSRTMTTIRLSLWLPIHINNTFHFTAGVLIKLIMKHKHFV